MLAMAVFCYISVLLTSQKTWNFVEILLFCSAVEKCRWKMDEISDI